MKKKLQLVLLPTINNKKGIFCMSLMNILLKNSSHPENNQYKNMHLYAISDEKPKLNDYCYDSLNNNIYKANEVIIHNMESIGYKKYLSKIVITTDEFLLVDYKSYEYGTGREYEAKVYLPTFTNDFITTYIERYNSRDIIKEIEVEYDCDHFQMPNKVIDILKINPNNTINVSLIEDKLYTKEEVIDKLLNYKTDLLIELSSCRESNKPLQKEFTDNWINKNL